DSVVDALKARTGRLVPTGEIGAVRADARAALDDIGHKLRDATSGPPSPPSGALARPAALGGKVAGGALGLGGLGSSIHHAEVDVRGKRMRARVDELRVLAPAGAPAKPQVRVSVAMAPRDGGATSEINVIGSNSEEAVGRVERFLDEAAVNDLKNLRIIHGY